MKNKTNKTKIDKVNIKEEIAAIPNEETQQAIQEAKTGKNMEKITFEDLKKEIINNF